MTQTTQTTLKTGATSSVAASQFLAAMRGGVASGQGGNGFADVLDQAVSSSLDQAKNFNDTSSSVSGQNTKDDTGPVARDTASTASSSTASNQNAATTTRVVSRRDDDKQTKTDDRQDKADDKSVSNDQQSKTASTDTTSTPKVQKTDGAKGDKEKSATEDQTASDAVAETPVTTAATGTSTATKTDTKADADATKTAQTSDQTDDTKSANDDLLAQIVQAEQAASALLSQMIDKRAARFKTKGTSDDSTAQTAQAATSTGTDSTTSATSGQGKADIADLWAAHKEAMAAQAGQQTDDSGIASQQTSTPTGKDNVEAGLTAAKKKEATFDAALSHDLLNTAAKAPTQATAALAAASTASSAVVGSGTAGTQTAAATATTGAVNGVSSNNAALGMGNGTSGLSYDTAGGLLSMKDAKAGTSSQASVVEQVTVQISKMAKAGDDQITLQLRPEELGRIDIKLHFGDDKSVQGTVIADNQATLDMLQKDSGSLQRALQDAGLRADTGCLQFSLRGDGGHSFAQSQNNGSSSSHTSSNSLYSTVTESDEDSAALDTYRLTPGRINLRV